MSKAFSLAGEYVPLLSSVTSVLAGGRVVVRRSPRIHVGLPGGGDWLRQSVRLCGMHGADTVDMVSYYVLRRKKCCTVKKINVKLYPLSSLMTGLQYSLQGTQVIS